MYSKIYWLTRLDSINALLITAACVCCGFIILSFMVGPMMIDDMDYDDGQKLKVKLSRWRKNAFIVGIVTAVLAVFVPTKDDAILIVAGGKAYEYVQKDTSLQQLPYKTTEYLKAILDKQIDATKKASEK